MVATMLPYSFVFLVVWMVLLVVWLLLDITTGPGAPLFLGGGGNSRTHPHSITAVASPRATFPPASFEPECLDFT